MKNTANKEFYDHLETIGRSPYMAKTLYLKIQRSVILEVGYIYYHKRHIYSQQFSCGVRIDEHESYSVRLSEQTILYPPSDKNRDVLQNVLDYIKQSELDSVGDLMNLLLLTTKLKIGTQNLW